MKKVIILKGLPASGKSSYARKMIDEYPGVYKRVNKDELRAMFDNSKWSKDNEQFILDLRGTAILRGLENGKHVIIDDTNLAPKHEAHIRQLVKGLAEVVVVDHFLEVDIEECIERDLKRANSVGEEVIRRMYEQFLKPKPEIYTPDLNLPKAIIVDIDGTIALKGDRSPFDWLQVGLDTKNEPICSLIGSLCGLHAMKQDILTILFCSGRDEICRPETEQWIKDNIKWATAHPITNHLFMRPNENNEKDSIIKRRIFEEKIKDKYNVLYVFDDRNQVVEMWRSLGLTVLQVADGNF